MMIAISLLTLAVAQSKPSVEVRVTLGADQKPFSGRLLITFTRNEPRPVVRSINWFNPEPAFAMIVKDWAPGEARSLTRDAIGYPVSLEKLPKGPYWVQAVVDRDRGGISVFDSPGNGYAKPKKIEHDPDKPTVVDLLIDQTTRERELNDTETVKFVNMPSKLLTDFHGKPMTMRAGVVLPPSWKADSSKKYPVVYEITGFGGDHTFAPSQSARKAWDLDGLEAIWVVLDANCRLGHHVFADSANNGPVAEALLTELIPDIEKRYRGIGNPAGRVVTGHSSGGWSSLWLQTRYPDSFAGCWSTSPDPVDFRDFQRINIYEPGANLFTDPSGQLRELSRGDRGRTLTFQGFSGMEDVMGRGGQLASFEAVFSPKMSDGTPRKLWDRKTGAIDPVTAKAWEKYDIRLRLERNWATLGPRLQGKVHVWMGELDTFYLDGAARLLLESQRKLQGGAAVEMMPNKTHALMDRTLSQRMKKEMKAALSKSGDVAK